MMISKINKAENKSLILAGVLILTATLVMSAAVLAADNDASQEASTTQAATVSIVGKVADTAITTITFPEGAASATISTPYNNVDTVTDAQVVAGSDSEPVVRLNNTSGGTLQAWLEITTWSDGVAASEDYELVTTATTNVAVVDDVLSADGNSASVDTSVTIPTTEYRALYLELVLSALSGKSGTSTLTVLGEAA
ncbi:MAG: hypothetical protein KAQ87_02350 [Candidatus Pacebacteria bacterium]|nr:hypothetical protein [Candidatus Paceibacterota bacterium]